MIGRYELLEQIGSGGMAVVYRGRDSALDREVAVKLLHPHLASAPESRARFAREARAVARLAHPGIVEIYDYSGDAAVESYLVTEFVRGPTLRGFAQEVEFGHPELGMLVGRALADALVHAHSAGVIHRDLKPENVLVRREEPPAVKLADFGIARIIASDERMTMTGALVGSPHHMAPEIVEGHDADARERRVLPRHDPVLARHREAPLLRPEPHRDPPARPRGRRRGSPRRGTARSRSARGARSSAASPWRRRTAPRRRRRSATPSTASSPRSASSAPRTPSSRSCATRRLPRRLPRPRRHDPRGARRRRAGRGGGGPRPRLLGPRPDHRPREPRGAREGRGPHPPPPASAAASAGPPGPWPPRRW